MNFKRHQIIFFLILFLAIFFRLFFLTNTDLTSDDALYSFRALGWFDFLGGGQTTPVQWFGSIPWWGNLSFHDAPPLVFLIQNLFFKFFGPTDLAAKLPFALAGIAVIFVFYLLIAILKTKEIALLGSLFLAISSYGIWGSRIGYLEGIEVLFIILSVYFFARYLKFNKQLDLLWWGVLAGLAILSKYTALFIVPAAILYLLIWKRGVFKDKNFWLSLVLMAVVLSPIMIYNFQLWQHRGHFDAALSSMVGMHPEDFITISARSVSFNPGGNLFFMVRALRDTSSWPFFLFMLLSLGYLLCKFYRKKAGILERIIIVNLLLLVAMFLFIGAGPRFFLISLPFWIAATAVLLADIWFYFKHRGLVLALKLFWSAVAVIVVLEVGYAFNTNILNEPYGRSGLMYSPSRFDNRGFNQLDRYLQHQVFTPLPKLRQPKSMEVFVLELTDIKNQSIYLVDETIDWFAHTWYIQKYPIYYGLPVISFSAILNFIPPGSDPLEILRSLEVKNVYYIYALDNSVRDSKKSRDSILMQNMSALSFILEERGADKELITNLAGEEVFAIYHLKFNN